MTRTSPTPWKPTKAQLLAARNKFVPDLIAKDLIVLFAGINPVLAVDGLPWSGGDARSLWHCASAVQGVCDGAALVPDSVPTAG